MPRDRTAILRSPEFLRHDTGEHPERAARLVVIDRELDRRGLLDGRPELPFAPASDDAIVAVHDPALLGFLAAVADAGGGWITPDTVVRRESLDVARLAAGAGVAMVDALIDGAIDRGMVLARPPGHHATVDEAMGFCLLNTVAIAAARARARGVERIAIIDWDVHHGNGTQDIFYDSGSVLYCSLHQSPLYPGTGATEETGTGEGVGTTLNVPLPPRTGGEVFLAAFHERIAPAIDAFAPGLLLVSAGYDAHRDDPIGGLRLPDESFRALMRDAVAFADRLCDGRLGVVLEGGYDVDALARCVADAIEILDGAAPAG